LLLSQDGSGQPYTRPAGTKRYVRLPLGIWELGWIVRLSGAALALLIILLDMQGGQAKPTWISPAVAKRRYDLSTETWSKGVGELETLGIVTRSKVPQGDIFDYRRLRNSYRVAVTTITGKPRARGKRRNPA
jgi:hypothetical protein